MTDSPRGVDDLLPYLTGEKPPLWEGLDPEFAKYVHGAFGIPETIQKVTITPRASSRRAAVVIGGADGAILFVLINDDARQKLEMKPHLIGPISQDPRVLKMANAAGGGSEIYDAIMALLQRHLSPDTARALLLPPVLH